jgi:hypothetical protein
VAALLMQVAVWGDVGLRAWRDQLRQGQDGARRNSSAILGFSLRLTLWVIVFLMVLDNFGVNITALVASLGVGGIAVALAVQNILGDLFASLSITLDKPFEIGDFIIVGDVLGFGRAHRPEDHAGARPGRRAGGVLQRRPAEKPDPQPQAHGNPARGLRAAHRLRHQRGAAVPDPAHHPRDHRAKPNIDFERAHFFMWGEWSLDFEVVYHFRSPDYILHMDAQQDIFLEIYRRFEQEGDPLCPSAVDRAPGRCAGRHADRAGSREPAWRH